MLFGCCVASICCRSDACGVVMMGTVVYKGVKVESGSVSIRGWFGGYTVKEGDATAFVVFLMKGRIW